MASYIVIQEGMLPKLIKANSKPEAVRIYRKLSISSDKPITIYSLKENNEYKEQAFEIKEITTCRILNGDIVFESGARIGFHAY
jgi:hypothetical protein